MRVMLSRVAAAAREAEIGPVALVSSDPGAPALAAELGIDLLDDGDLPWNEGLLHALAAAASRRLMRCCISPVTYRS